MSDTGGPRWADGYYWARPAEGYEAEPVRLCGGLVTCIGDRDFDHQDEWDILEPIAPHGTKGLSDEEMREFLRRVVAETLPAPAGSLLVLKMPGVDWQDRVALSGLHAVIQQVKREHGFAGVIALPQGAELQSLDLEALRGIGLQPIPDEPFNRPDDAFHLDTESDLA